MKRLLLALLAAVAVVATTAGPSQAAKPTPVAPYWGHWSSQAVVYDKTGGFKVAEAVSEWRSSGWNVVMTSDPSRANITVSTDVIEGYGPSNGIGSAQLSKSGDLITGCKVILLSGFATDPIGEHMAIHELGHCGGLPHSTNTKSVMYESVGRATVMTAPSRNDLRWMAANCA